jgi:DNA/RNA-binding domain of Phe-tRNA-synthetase-like protein
VTEPVRGWVEADLGEEFPDLALHHLSAPGATGRSPREVREHLRRLSDRFTGARAVRLRLEPVPAAYRAFFRQVGIDPEERRTPAENLALVRMKEGGYRSRGRVADALTIATAETSVAVSGFDADRVVGRLGLRPAQPGERLGTEGRTLSAGEIVLVDDTQLMGALFGEPATSVEVGRRTERVLLVAIRVAGVPMMAVEEALWSAAAALAVPA